MGLTRKQGAIRDSTARAHPTPDQLLVPLPQVVLDRFPELAEWQAENNRRLSEWRDALDRRQEETDDKIRALP